MALGDLAGRCRVNVRDPKAQAECDRCGLWWPLDRLRWQFQWGGAALFNENFLVCPRCLDTPFEQYRSLILPPDPVPRPNPRRSPDITPIAPSTTPENQGFTGYVFGAPGLGVYPMTPASVLAAVAQASGVPTPTNPAPFFKATTITPTNQTLSLVQSNPLRNFFLIYNPWQSQVQFSFGTAVWGVSTNLILGPGEAYFWATAQGLQPTFTGPMTLIGLTPGAQVWTWEAASQNELVTEGTGIVIETEGGQPIVLEG